MAAALLLASTAATSQAQVLEQVPGDALAVLKVKSLNGTSTKVAKFATDLGLAAFMPQMGDPLGALQGQVGIQQGLNKDGDFAIAYLDNAQFAGVRPDQSMVVLIPVADYQAFLGNFPGAVTTGEISQIAMGPAKEPGYVAHWGNYAALSPTQSVIAKKPSAGLKAQGASAKELDSKDLIIYANFAAIRPKIAEPLKQGRDEALNSIEDELAVNPQMAKFTPVIKAIVTQVFNGMDAFMRDAQGATFGINLSDEGLSISLLAEFQPNSYLGNTVASIANTDKPLLGGLPSGKYLMYGGAVMDPKVATKLLDDMTAPVLKELATVEGGEAKAVSDYVATMKKFIAANTGATFGMVAPSGQPGRDPLVQFIGSYSGDVAAMQAAQKDFIQQQEQVMAAFGMPADAVKTAVAPAAKTVEGVTFDQMTTTIKPDPNNPAAQQQAMMMQWMYGQAGPNALMGAVGSNLLVASGISDEMLAEAIKATKTSAAPLGDIAGVKSVATNLPAKRIAVVYVPVDEIVTTGLSYAKQMGAGLTVQLPPELPPIGAAIATEGTAIREDIYVPTSLVQSLVAAGMQAAMQMQGGGRPGAGMP